MKVTGSIQSPSSGASNIEGSPEVTPSGPASVGRSDEGGFAEKISSSGSSTETAGAASTAGSVRDVPVSDLAEGIRAGQLTPQAAAEQVLQRVLDRQLDRSAPVEVREKVREALRDALENDPFLVEKLRQLG